ncbi:hypothetical protein [Streptomyces sp. WAC01280]|uniref:hypothetical protein n=1 Tax=Streptomyces sp. WAC01280 TaxID=2487424 RepID=UPI000F79F812|nr:hypothetical protein [Streptomyces sp. WAC01280]RSS54940.1 hypothetical protein EF909_17145 [Streptomyces sp. WAC01280]
MALDTPYRAIFCDLLSDQTIDILPLRDVQFDDYIGKAGSLSGTIPIPDREIAARVRQVQEGRTAVYLERGGDLWWGGIIWTSTLQSSERGVLTLSIQAATFDSYAARRRIRTKIEVTTPTDQLAIARKLWAELQKPLGGNISVEPGEEVSPVKRTASWRKGDETLYSEALEQLASLDDGFEHQIMVYRDPVDGRRIRQLRLGAPKIRTGATDLVFDRPGTILSYSFPRDATRGGTTSMARGASINSNAAAESRPLFSGEKESPLIKGGWPRIDLSSDHNEISSQATLEKVADAELAQAAGAVVIPEITIRLGGVVPPALLGRSARIRITDEWYTPGLDARYRIIGVKVRPPERGRPDTAELYLEEA